jgi:hypothetical protein
MKKTAQKFSLAVILITAISFAANATNVSGGIYSNTTWTLANSPYIVVDTVVVFPGVTLTIEPGVVVKFDDDKGLEIRQASLIAVGTITDSIVFTSNSSSPFPGIWREMYLNGGTMNSQVFYCSFHYGNMGIRNSQVGPINIKNSTFTENYFGINVSNPFFYDNIIESCNFYNNTWGVSTNERVTINNCNFFNNQYALNCQNTLRVNNSFVNNNQTGIWGAFSCIVKNSAIDSNNVGIFLDNGNTDSIINCEIKYNATGINSTSYGSIVIKNVIESNTIGIHLWSIATIYCNKICNNTLYHLQNEIPGTNVNISGNYWCTTDSATISSDIYDGYDNLSVSLLNFMPIDTSQCYLTGCNLQLTATVTNATCDTCHNGTAAVNVANGFAPYTYTWFTSPIQSGQTATGLASGTYTVCVSDANGCTACNSNVFVDSSNCTGFAITANATSATCSACNDGFAWVSVNAGTAPYNYTWYTSPIQTADTATGLLQGWYSVCVTDLYGCSACDSVEVGTGDCSAHFNLFPDTIIHHYYAVNMASGVMPLSYSWDWGDGSFNDTIPYPDHTYASAGYYVICLSITDSAGCTNTYCNSYYLQLIPNPLVYVHVIPFSNTGIHEEANNESLLVFPNPFTDQMTVLLPPKDSKATIKIYNVRGEEELNHLVETQKSNLDVSALAKGIHVLEITAGNKTVNRKIIKQ